MNKTGAENQWNKEHVRQEQHHKALLGIIPGTHLWIQLHFGARCRFSEFIAKIQPMGNI